MPELPKQVMCWHGQWPLAHAGTWATTRYPDDAVSYVPKSDFDRVKVAAELGLAMAEANDLWKTAETIREALEITQDTRVIHDAVKVAYSSIVGQSIMLLNDKGACIGQLSVINCENPQEIADEVVAALKSPNQHGYRVGVAVGKAAQREEGHE